MNIKAGFERISKYANDEQVLLPTRKTKCSAGYDMYVAEDTIVPSYDKSMLVQFEEELLENHEMTSEEMYNKAYILKTIENLVKKYKRKTTLVPMGVKAYMPDDWYLQLSMRSSMPNKHWLMIANAPGIIDADYYNNPDNEGHIFFQVINLLPFDIQLRKGDCIGQGIFLPYGVCDGDNATGERKGGFGSTEK